MGRGMYCTKADGMITKLYAARDALSAVIDALSNEVAHIEGDNRALVEQARDLESENAALEAQAAVDAKVREAVGAVPQLLWYEALAYLAGAMRRENVPNRENIDQRLCAAINAALAEREGRGGDENAIGRNRGAA